MKLMILMFKNDKVFDFNSTKIPNVLNLDLKSR